MSCTYRDRTETILAYVRQELNIEAQEAFESHYFICAECASDVLFYEKTVLAMQGQGGIIFARPKQQRLESIARIRHFIYRWSKSLSLVLGEGGTVRVLAGYALLIIFLGVSSFFLIKVAGSPSQVATRNSDPVAPAATTPLVLSSSSPNVPSPIHVEWPQNSKLTNNSILQKRLDSIQTIYQVQRDYQAAGEALESLEKTLSKREEQVKIFLAVCLINQGRTQEAITLLNPLARDASSQYNKEAQDLLRAMAGR